MAGISIRLSSFSDFTEVNVEGLGIIKVRKESSNQGARISEITRDIFNLQDQGKSIEKKIKKLHEEGKDESSPEFEKLNKKGGEALDMITNLRAEHHALRKARLSDNEGGKLVEILFDNTDDTDISKLLAAGELTEQEEEKDGTDENS